ncbi:zinc finger protein 84-like [Micropterus salmoides]|uniref:zinc finger protein 84-like n=1 Tax=Micropterus salmoides TaxID=27706 RepID=UPI0018EA722E|nr:zinc finger protein 84-like [Micropterus salmoides]
MSKVQMLRGFINQRLTAAAEEIFGLFERTISEYEEELCRSKEENQRHRKLLDAVFQPEVRLHRADVQQLLVSKEEVPPEQQQWSPSLDQEDPPEPPHIKDEWSPSLDQEDPLETPHIAGGEQEELWTSQKGEQLPGLEEADITKFRIWASSQDVQQLFVSKEEVPPEQQQQQSPSLDQEDPPEPPHIKEEQEELRTSQEGEQLPGLEEADITKFLFIPVPVKSEEDDEEKLQSSQLHQSQTEQMETAADGKDCGGPEPARNFNPDSHLQPATHDQTSLSSESETDNSCDWETRGPQPGLNPLQNNEVPVSDQECNTGETSVSSSECATNLGHKEHLQNHNGTQTGGKPLSGSKPFSCSVCKKGFSRKTTLVGHLRIHTGEKLFSCSVCAKRFGFKGNLDQHLKLHTGEKLCICSVCGKRFALKRYLRSHMKVHTGEKPFSCSVCEKRFGQKQHLVQHIIIHTGEKKFRCSVCGKRFAEELRLNRHLRVHTGEKPFNCSVCGKRFSQKGVMRQHLTVHTGEKRFSCSVCDRRFAWRNQLKTHKCVDESSHGNQPGENREAEDCGRPEPARNSNPDRLLQPDTEDKTEDSDGDWEKAGEPQSSQLHQSQTEENRDTEHLKTEDDGEVCGGPEPARNFNPDSPLQPATHDQTSLSSESETDNSCDWETRGPQPGLNPLQNNEVPVSDQECNTGETSVSSSECATNLGHKEHLQNHNGTQTGGKPLSGSKPFSCSVCKRSFRQRHNLIRHGIIHTGEKPFSCSICKRSFSRKQYLEQHMIIHTGEKLFSCSVCGKRFALKGYLSSHMHVHTGEKSFSCSKPFSCSVCKKGFRQKTTLDIHLRIHTGEKPFSCSVCDTSFRLKHHLVRHLRIHTGEKPFRCSVCGKRFSQKGTMTQHMTVHTGERQFSCSVCGKSFALLQAVKKHKCAGESSGNK